MKILYVTAFNPICIPYGSEYRNRRFIRFLRTKGDLDIMTLERFSDNTDMEYIRLNFLKHHAFDVVGKPISAWKKAFHLLPWQLSQLYNSETRKAIHKIVVESGYDLIFVSKLFPVKYFVDLPAKWREKVVMDFDDILSDLYCHYYKDFLRSRKNSLFLLFYEHLAMERFRRVFVCSDNAVEKINVKYRKKVGVIPNVFELEESRFLKPGEDPNRLLFVGSLDYFANLEGLGWFLKTVWPEARKKYPDLQLDIIGKSWKKLEHIRAQLGTWPGVEISANVKSVVPYYQKCFASIVPILDGSGTRIKILESVSLGRPVLTSAKGMEGLSYRDRKELLLFKDAATFIKSYEELLSDGAYARMVNAAFRFSEENYSPRNFELQMNKNWEEIISRDGK